MAEVKYPEAKYKVAVVGPIDSFTFKGDDGSDVTLTTYSLQLEGVAEWVKLSQKPESAAPKVGDELEGHVEDTGKYGFKFVKKRGSGGFGGGKGGYSPGAQWSAAMEVAAIIVGDYFKITGKKPEDIGEMLARVEAVTPKVKKMVDDFAAAEKPKESTGGDKPAEKPAEQPAKDGVVIEDIDEKELSW